MPKTGDFARESGEYAADWHCTIFMHTDMRFPPCPDCYQVVEYVKVARPMVPAAVPLTETLCPSCGRGVLRFQLVPIPEGSVAFCEPHDPWNAHQECRSRFRYDATGGTGWQPWPVPPKDIDPVGRAWYPPRDQSATR